MLANATVGVLFIMFEEVLDPKMHTPTTKKIDESSGGHGSTEDDICYWDKGVERANAVFYILHFCMVGIHFVLFVWTVHTHLTFRRRFQRLLDAMDIKIKIGLSFGLFKHCGAPEEEMSREFFAQLTARATSVDEKKWALIVELDAHVDDIEMSRTNVAALGKHKTVDNTVNQFLGDEKGVVDVAQGEPETDTTELPGVVPPLKSLK